MKVLILSCNTGEGHNSCAKAIELAMQQAGVECEVKDTLALVSETLSRSVSDMYVFSTKNTSFERAYKFGAFVSDRLETFKSPVYQSNKIYAKKLYDYIQENHFDAVICVHLFPAEALTALHRKAEMNVPTMFVMTDYTCIPFITETELDAYVIPHEHLIEEFVEKGLPREKIYPLGLPINSEAFTSHTEKMVARRKSLENLQMQENQLVNGHWYLVMSGSMGFGNLGELVGELLDQTNPNDHIVCVCGRNEKAKASLEEAYGDDERLLVVGYTNQVSLLMDASDVIFTKPGGITSTESIVKNIPLIHTEPIPGLEEKNALFFHYHGMSYHTNDVREQVRQAMRLCEDDDYRERMLVAQRNNARPNAAQEVVAKIQTMAVYGH